MPKSQLFYSTSQAARLLGISDDTVRRWVAEGRLDAETTAGGQIRIPVEELRRVKAEGRLLPRAAQAARRPRPGSEAARLAEQVEAERLQLLLGRLRQKREEAERRARLEEERQRQEREEAERRAWEREEAERRAREQQQQREIWRLRAARRFESLPAEARLAALEVFEGRLQAMDPLPEDGYLGRLLDAVEKAARLPLRVEADNQQLMQRLLGEHWELAREQRYTDLRDQALVSMHKTLAGLEVDTPLAVREAAARQALEPVLHQYRRRKLREELGARIDERLRSAGATAEEREQARLEWQRRSAQDEIDEAALRVAAGELEQAFLAQVQQRRQAEEEARKREAEAAIRSVRESYCRSVARSLLSTMVPAVLRRMERDGELEFEGEADYRETCETIEKRLQERVTQLLIGGANSMAADTRRRIEKLIEDEVEEVAEVVEDEEEDDD
ncbi:MAG: helix-turn-helix domain-containing protein [Bryobacterales bacterium]|nr:helix-turn-helix domain-containing protein [Bryobacterales bacterium]